MRKYTDLILFYFLELNFISFFYRCDLYFQVSNAPSNTVLNQSWQITHRVATTPAHTELNREALSWQESLDRKKKLQGLYLTPTETQQSGFTERISVSMQRPSWHAKGRPALLYFQHMYPFTNVRYTSMKNGFAFIALTTKEHRACNTLIFTWIIIEFLRSYPLGLTSEFSYKNIVLKIMFKRTFRNRKTTSGPAEDIVTRIAD